MTFMMNRVARQQLSNSLGDKLGSGLVLGGKALEFVGGLGQKISPFVSTVSPLFGAPGMAFSTGLNVGSKALSEGGSLLKQAGGAVKNKSIQLS